jgi:membrane protein
LSIDVDRRRVVQALTFWLRPRFVLRVVNRFQRIAGFDRAIALGSSAFTAVIPLAIVTSAVASALGGKGTADRIIERYQLTGGGADAVEAVFAPASGASTSLGVAGFLFLILAVLSFSRAMQRLFEQTWELPPLSVRNSLNGLVWIGGLGAFLGVNGLIRAALGRSTLELTAALITMPLCALFLVWTGRVLSARRIARTELLPFAGIAAVATAAYSVGANVYVPRLFNSSATRYGAIGAVFAIISALFCVMVVVTASAAAGREVQRELERIRRGERPADDDVRRQWDEITAEARSRWKVLRTRGGGA